MFIDESFEVIYLNCKIDNTDPFLGKLTPKNTKKVVALLKKYDRKLSHNTISALAFLICSKAGDGYKKQNPGYDEISDDFVSEPFETDLPENTSSLKNLFNSYDGVYHHNIIIVLDRRSCFSDSVFTEENNRISLNSVYQCNIGGYSVRPNVVWKLNLPFRKRLGRFLYSGLFNIYETLCGTAFEVLLNKVFSDNLKEKKQRAVIDKKPGFECNPVKIFTYRISNFINLIIRYNVIFEKLLTPFFQLFEKRFLIIRSSAGLMINS